MLDELRFALYAIKMNIRSSAELRASFLINIFGMAINNTSFVILWLFFVKAVGDIGGWGAAEIIGLQAFTAISYGTIFLFASGIRMMPEYISNGSFDRFLLSPRNLLLRVATSWINISTIGDILFGIICLVFFLILIQPSLAQAAILLLTLLASIIIFLAVVIFVYSISFYFIDSGFLSHSLFEIFFSPAMFHGGAFQGRMRFVYTFIIPSLVLGTLPVEAISTLDFGKLALITAISIGWFLVSLWVFKRAVRRYESANFIGTV